MRVSKNGKRIGRPPRTQCPKGHEYAVTGTVVIKRGKSAGVRRCAVCIAETRKRCKEKERKQREQRKESWFF